MSDLTRKPSLPSRSPVSAGLSPSPLAAAGPSAAGGVLQPPPTHPSTAAAGVPPHAAVAGAPQAAYSQPGVAPMAAAAPAPSLAGQQPGGMPSAAAFPAAASMTAVAPPPGTAPVSRGPYPISAFVTKVSGAYLASVVGIWSTQDGRHGKTEKLGSSIGLGHTSYRSLRNKGVPEGAFVRMGLEVALGKNCEDQTVFIYEEACVLPACLPACNRSHRHL